MRRALPGSEMIITGIVGRFKYKTGKKVYE